MANKNSRAFICLTFLNLLASTVVPSLSDANEHDDARKTFIVYLGSLPKASSSYSPTSHHLSLLRQVTKNGVNDVSSLIRSYGKSFNGFAAKLTSDEKKRMAQMEGVVSVFESKTLQTQTTRSWDFMGFEETAIKGISSGVSDVIVGVIDSGIWPESKSFNDQGFGDVPKKWRGTCAGGTNFTCNKKIIGARYYPDDVDSARDYDGHGTHTASIAAGNVVHGANFYGLAQGTARGGLPYARIAVYSVCKMKICEEKDILAAFDDAISDGVDIISVSLAYSAEDFVMDVTAIGSFHAMEGGILTVQAAGNEGPLPGSLSSVAPWVLAVAASSTDRKIIDKIVLGNGRTLIGNSVNSFASDGSKFPLAKINGNSSECPKPKADNCSCFDTDLVKGKIVLCPDDLPIFSTAKSQGVVGVITRLKFNLEDVSLVVPTPSLALSPKFYNIISSYVTSTKDPKAEIKKSEIVRDKTAPKAARFSSRGPNTIVAEVLKPDISAPGMEILAAYSPVASVSEYLEDTRSVRYKVESGTSMSCPHASGIAAYVKSLHPHWSPAAIKSAILTTAKPMKKAYPGDLIGEFEYGFGHVNPIQALHPGLVYDLSKADYVEMLCNFGYNASKLKQISGRNNSCPVSSSRDLVKNLNYPSLTVKVVPLKPFRAKLKRTVTNVGFANSTYKAIVLPNSMVNITVKPEILLFKSLNEKKSFVVTIVGRKISKKTAVSSSLIWSDGTHNARSPIVVMGSECC